MDKYSAMLSAYLDGELTDSEKTELENHLEACEMCRALLESYRAIDSDAMLAAPPEGFTAKVMDKVRQDAKPKKKRIIPFRYGTLAAAMVALVLLGASGVFGNLFSGVGTKSASVENAMAAMDEALEDKASMVRGNDAAFAAAPAEAAPAAGEAAEEAAPAEAAPADMPMMAAAPTPEPETPAEYGLMEAAPEAEAAIVTDGEAVEILMVSGTVSTAEAVEGGYNITLESADSPEYDGISIFVPKAVAGDIELSAGLAVSIELDETGDTLTASYIEEVQ